MTYKQSLQSNTWKYAIFLVANKRIFSVILSAYYLTIPGVDTKQIGLIILISSIAGFLLEIPGGYLSDRMGYKRALVFSRFCALISTLLFLFANSIIPLILGGVFLSAANAFLSGTGSVFIHETLRELGKDKDYATIMGKIRSIGFAVPIVLMVLTPFLTTVSFRLPFVVGLLMDIVGTTAAISLTNPRTHSKHTRKTDTANIISALKEGKKIKFTRLALFVGLTSGVIGITGRYRAAYQFALEVPVEYYGLFLGISGVVISLLLFQTGKFKKMVSYDVYLAIRALIFLLLVLVLGITSKPFIVVGVFVLLSILLQGSDVLDNSFMLDAIKDSKFKATLLSIKSQTATLVVGVGSFLFGISVSRFGYRDSFIILFGLTMLMLVPQYLYVILGRRTAQKHIRLFNERQPKIT